MALGRRRRPNAASSPRPLTGQPEESRTQTCETTEENSSCESSLHSSDEDVTFPCQQNTPDTTMENLSASFLNNASISKSVHRRHSSPGSHFSEPEHRSTANSPRQKRPPPARSNLPLLLLIFLALAIVLPVAFFFWSFQLDLTSTPRRNLSATKEELRLAFPSQPNSSWALFSATLRPLLAESPSSRPAILLLSGPPNSPTLACMASRLAEAAAVHLGGSSCRSVVPPGGDLTSGDTSKLALDREVLGAYGKGERCFRFDRLEQLSKPQLLLLHAWGDGDFSPLKQAFLLLVVRHSNGRDEHSVEDFLLKHWAPTVGDDEAGALNSRLANNVLIVREEEALKESSCIGSN